MLFVDLDTEAPEEAPGEGPPFRLDIKLLSLQTAFEANPALVVSTSEEKALAYGRHLENQEDEDWRMFGLVRLTPAQIRERIFKGTPYGPCAVDPVPEGSGKVVGVNGLHLV